MKDRARGGGAGPADVPSEADTAASVNLASIATDWAGQIMRFRRVHAIKQAHLAELLKVNQASVSRWESGRAVPDLSIQRRLRDLMYRTLRDEILIRHCIMVSPAQVLLSSPERKAVAASAGYCAAHGVSQSEIVGMDMTPTHGEDSFRLWCVNRDHGFYRGEVASTTSIALGNSLTGQFRDRPVKVVLTPVRFASGLTLLRSERQPLTAEQYQAALRTNGGPIRIQTMDELVG